MALNIWKDKFYDKVNSISINNIKTTKKEYKNCHWATVVLVDKNNMEADSYMNTHLTHDGVVTIVHTKGKREEKKEKISETGSKEYGLQYKFLNAN